MIQQFQQVYTQKTRKHMSTQKLVYKCSLFISLPLSLLFDHISSFINVSLWKTQENILKLKKTIHIPTFKKYSLFIVAKR